MKGETMSTKRTRKSSTRHTERNRENKLINMAMNLAEEKLKDGTASSQLITHFLKLATVREQLEIEKLRSDLEVDRAKIKDMESKQDIKKLFTEAIEAMNLYGGAPEERDSYEDYDE